MEMLLSSGPVITNNPEHTHSPEQQFNSSGEYTYSLKQKDLYSITLEIAQAGNSLLFSNVKKKQDTYISTSVISLVIFYLTN